MGYVLMGKNSKFVDDIVIYLNDRNILFSFKYILISSDYTLNSKLSFILYFPAIFPSDEKIKKFIKERKLKATIQSKFNKELNLYQLCIDFKNVVLNKDYREVKESNLSNDKKHIWIK